MLPFLQENPTAADKWCRIDWDEQVSLSSEVLQQVNVPELHVPTELGGILHGCIDPCATSETCGIDLYTTACTVVQAYHVIGS